MFFLFLSHSFFNFAHCLSFCLSTCLSVPVYQSVCLSVCLSACLSVSMTDSIIPLLPLCNSYLFLAKTVNVPCGKPSARLWSRSEISTSLSRELLYKKKSNSNYNCNKAKSNNDNEWEQRKLDLTKYTNHRHR